MAQQYTFAEVKNHNNNQSTWIVVHNNVYDVTAFLNEVIVSKYFTSVTKLVVDRPWGFENKQAYNYQFREINISKRHFVSYFTVIAISNISISLQSFLSI